MNKTLPYSPKLCSTRVTTDTTELWRGAEEGYKQERRREEVRRKISAVRRAVGLRRAGSSRAF